MKVSDRRRGWCPGALRPMRTGDGLLVRVRITGGAVSPNLARALAQAARDFGNGLIDLSSRCNLQIRGVSEEGLPGLQARLRELALIDQDAEAEQVRNVMMSPLAGIDPTAADVSDLVTDLEHALIQARELYDLPAKFFFSVDGGGALPLDVEADIGIRALADGRFSLSAAGLSLCEVDKTTVLPEALDLARVFLALREDDERRMDSLVARLALRATVPHEPSPRRWGRCHFEEMTDGVRAVAATLQDKARASSGKHADTARTPPALAAQGHPPHARRGEGVRALAGWVSFSENSGAFAAAIPFGRLDATQLFGLADLAERLGAQLRLSPWRAILLAPVERSDVRVIENSVAGLGLVTDPANPLLHIAACPGKPACLSGEADVQADARRLSEVLGDRLKPGVSVHVSGCPKGCARREPATISLVADSGCYGLAFHATAGEARQMPLLAVDEMMDFMARLDLEAYAAAPGAERPTNA